MSATTFDKRPDFSGFKTYKWAPIKDAAKVSDLVDKQFKDAVDAVLATEGLTTVEGSDGNTYLGCQPAACQEKQFNSYSTGWVWARVERGLVRWHAFNYNLWIARAVCTP